MSSCTSKWEEMWAIPRGFRVWCSHHMNTVFATPPEAILWSNILVTIYNARRWLHTRLLLHNCFNPEEIDTLIIPLCIFWINITIGTCSEWDNFTFWMKSTPAMSRKLCQTLLHHLWGIIPVTPTFKLIWVQWSVLHRIRVWIIDTWCPRMSKI